MHLLYGTKPLPHVSGLTLTLSSDVADVSLGVMWTGSSNFPSPLLKQSTFMCRGIGLHASIVGKEGLHVSVTNRVIPKSFKVRPDDSSAASSLVETFSFSDF